MKTFANVSEAFDISYDFRYKDTLIKIQLKSWRFNYLTVPTEDLGESIVNDAFHS